ncbi:hypothetical protein JCM8097_001212 [Rhodosporidiobolus ruineniae]
MPQASAVAYEAARGILRIIGALVAVLDPVKGAKASTLRGLAEDVRGIEKECGTVLSSNIRQLLHMAIASLSSSTAIYTPFATAFSAQLVLTQAVNLLTFSPPPASRPSFSRLPAELIAHIVEFCQFDDPRLRQDTNLALSRTCRAFYRAVSPILAVERHIFTPGQLERIAKSMLRRKAYDSDDEDDGDPRRDDVAPWHLCELTIDLTVDELQRKPGTRWVGRLVEPLVMEVGDICCMRALRLRLRPTAKHDHIDNLLRALGMSGDDWAAFVPDCLNRAEAVEIPVFSCGYVEAPAFLQGLLQRSSATVASFGTSATPYETSAEDTTSFVNLFPADRSFVHLEGLSAPFLSFDPSTLLRLLRPPIPLLTAQLSRLDVAFDFDHPTVDAAAEDLKIVFRLLAPSLRRLALRVRNHGVLPRSRGVVHSAVLDSLALCLNLEHLEVGGGAVSDVLLQSYMVPVADDDPATNRGGDDAADEAELRRLGRARRPPVLTTLSHLRHLTLLPLLGGFNLTTLPSALETGLPSGLRSLVLCLPVELDGVDEHSGWEDGR